MRPAIMFNMVVIGTALAALAQGNEPGLTLAPTDPAAGQPGASVSQTTEDSQANSSWFAETYISEPDGSSFVIAGDAQAFSPQPLSIWQGDVGEGFRSDVRTLSLETGVALGVQAFGGRRVHDLALLSLSYGHMLGNVVN